MLGFPESLHHASPQNVLNGPDAQGGQAGRLLAGAQMFRLVDLVIEAVEHEIHQVRHYRLSPFALQKLHQMIVARRGEFHQYLAHDAHPGLFDVQERDTVEIPDDSPAHSTEPKQVHMSGGNEILCFFQPFFVHGVH